MIPVQHEDVSELAKWGMGLEKIVEKCTFCQAPTRFWHTSSNHPVCEPCAKTHKVGEIPPSPSNRRKP